DIVARDIAPADVMLAAGLSNSEFSVESRVSGILRAQIAQDGRLLAGAIRMNAGRGWLGNASDPAARIPIDGAQLQLTLDPDRRALIFDPILIRSGPTEVVLQAIAEAPASGDQPWPVLIAHGQAVLGAERGDEPPLVLDRISVRGSWEPRALRLVLKEGTLSGATAGVAISGAVSFGGQTPMVSLGIASNQLPVSAAKRLWPAPIAAGTRGWIMDHVDQGLIDRLVISANVPLDKVGKPDVELPDESVHVDMSAIGG